MDDETANRRATPDLDWATVATLRVVGCVAVVCAECGRAFAAARRDATFCSRACTQRSRRRTARRCVSCGRPLVSRVQATARYCSTACRMRAYRRRATDGGGAP